MKGPGVRLDLDVRRVWECPQCGRISKSDGSRVARRCACTDEGVWMRLVRDGRPGRPLTAGLPAQTPASSDAAPAQPATPD